MNLEDLAAAQKDLLYYSTSPHRTALLKAIDELYELRAELTTLRAKAAEGEKLRHVVADNMTDASQARAKPAVADYDAATLCK